MVRPRALATLVLLLVALGAGGCGRSLPEESAEPVPGGGDQSGAFDDLGGLSQKLRLEGPAAAVAFARAGARGFREEEPDVKVAVAESDSATALGRLCAGKIQVAGTERRAEAKERRACERAGGLVELHVANAAGKRIHLLTTVDVLAESFEVEAFLDFAITNNEQIAAAASLEPVSVDELQDTQTAFERALSGL